MRRAARALRPTAPLDRRGCTDRLRRLRAEADLRRAFAADRLTACYEPIISLATGQVVGFEALTRLRRDDGALSSFGPHVGIAEESGLILPIGAWILRQACLDLLQWDLPLWVSVNVSARQITDPSFLPHLKDILAQTCINPERLKLEITETTIMRDADEQTLWSIKDLGVCLHMDDFGTGYSSLASLHRFPIDVLKIDRSFIRDTSACRDYAAVLHSVVALAHNLGMEVVAEGLEQPSQVALLRAMHCDYGQGYHWSRGVAAEDVPGLVRQVGLYAQSA